MNRPNPSPCRICDGNYLIRQIHPECMYRLGSNQWAHAHVLGQNSMPQVAIAETTTRNRSEVPPARVSRPLVMRLGMNWSSSGYGGGEHSVNNLPASQNYIRRSVPEAINRGAAQAQANYISHQAANPASSSGRQTSLLPSDTILDDEDLQGEDQEDNQLTSREVPKYERRINNANGQVEQKCTTAEHWFPLSHYKPGIGKCRRCRDNYQRLRDDRLSRNEYPRCGHPNRNKGIACPVCKTMKDAKAAERGSGAKGKGRGRGSK